MEDISTYIISYENGHRFNEAKSFETKLHMPYDYAEEGLAKHILSHKITETTNPLLRAVLDYYEYAIIYMLKFADNLKQFKNYNWKNR